VVAVKGKTRGVKIYQLLAGPPEEPVIAPTPDDLRMRDITERAFTAYLGRDFRSALELYTELARAFPRDPLGALYVARCGNTWSILPAEWDGVMRLKAK
jgi:adenylate cyclase